ncbi:reverse transcriptase-like protein, partial [Laceyella sediminis]
PSDLPLLLGSVLWFYRILNFLYLFIILKYTTSSPFLMKRARFVISLETYYIGLLQTVEKPLLKTVQKVVFLINWLKNRRRRRLRYRQLANFFKFMAGDAILSYRQKLAQSFLFTVYKFSYSFPLCRRCSTSSK